MLNVALISSLKYNYYIQAIIKFKYLAIFIWLAIVKIASDNSVNRNQLG